eukprot:6181858-Pleurochrysis_carterae.AAC.1
MLDTIRCLPSRPSSASAEMNGGRPRCQQSPACARTPCLAAAARMCSRACVRASRDAGYRTATDRREYDGGDDRYMMWREAIRSTEREG